MNATKSQWLRFLIIAPFTAATLAIFGLYFTGLDRWDMRNGVKKYLWGASARCPGDFQGAGVGSHFLALFPVCLWELFDLRA